MNCVVIKKVLLTRNWCNKLKLNKLVVTQDVVVPCYKFAWIGCRQSTMNLECPIQSVDWQAGPPPCSPPFPCEVQSWTEVLGKICILEAFLSYTCPTPPLSHGKRLTRVSRIFPKFHRCIMCGGRGGQLGGFKMQGFLQKKYHSYMSAKRITNMTSLSQELFLTLYWGKTAIIN